MSSVGLCSGLEIFRFIYSILTTGSQEDKIKLHLCSFVRIMFVFCCLTTEKAHKSLSKYFP